MAQINEEDLAVLFSAEALYCTHDTGLSDRPQKSESLL